jgi:hypothetical protein
MPDIRYVVFSDMHLGAENSLLTNLKYDTPQTDTTQASPVMTAMVNCLRELITKNEGKEKPRLVLNGDLIELALTSENKAGMAFQRFIELIYPENGDFLFDKEIIYLPGNHDHNLWEFSRNVWYHNTLSELKPGDYIPNEQHSTELFSPPKIESLFLTPLIRSYPHLKDVSLHVCYPARGVINHDHTKCVIFCHGHYVESMYWLMTTLRSLIFPNRQEPVTFEGIETENYAWVDFFWSTLGRSGSVGKDINLIYDKLQDAAQVKDLISTIATSLSRKKRNVLTRWMEEKAVKIILELSLGRMAASERNEPNVELTPDATAGLKKLMEGPLYHALNRELQNDIPDDFAFLFGHTHKPFIRWITYEGYPYPVKVFNSGGWVVDTLNKQPLHGGAFILVDDNLDVMSLQMYKEGNYKPTPQWLMHDHTHEKLHSAFFDRIEAIIKENPSPWQEFEKITEHEVNIRYRNLAEIIREK